MHPPRHLGIGAGRGWRCNSSQMNDMGWDVTGYCGGDSSPVRYIKRLDWTEKWVLTSLLGSWNEPNIGAEFAAQRLSDVRPDKSPRPCDQHPHIDPTSR